MSGEEARDALLRGFLERLAQHTIVVSKRASLPIIRTCGPFVSSDEHDQRREGRETGLP